MLNSPDNANTVRCGMCGQYNPADRDLCEHCGARLRPMTPEELGLSSGPETPSERPSLPPEDSLRREAPRPEPSRQEPAGDADDPFAALRAALDDEATAVGPSAEKSTIDKFDPFEQVEPDFMIGGSQPAPPQSLEERLAGSAPGTEIDLPDWLADESAPVVSPGHDGFEIPDWLSEASRPEDRSAEEPPEDMSDWLSGLRDAAQEEQGSEEPLELPDWLNDDTPTGKPPERAPYEEDLSWMKRPTETPEQGETVSIEASPSGREKPSLDEDLAWLRQAAASSEGQPAASEVPDWLAGELASPGPTPVTPTPEQELEWLRPASEVAEREGEKAAEEPSDDTLQAWLAAEAPSAPAEVPSSSLDDMPDWLRSAMESEPPKTPDAVEEIEPPRWLPVEEHDTAPLVATGMPDWLTQVAQATHEAEVEEPETASEQAGMAAAEAAHDEPAPEGEEIEVPAWLGGLGLGAVEPSAEVKEPASPSAVPEVPEWLRHAEEVSASAVPEEPGTAGEDLEVPAWLGLGSADSVEGAGQPAAEPLEPGVERPVLTPETDVAEWLANVIETPPVELESAAGQPAPSGEPEIPDWLAGVAGTPPAEPAPFVEAEAPVERAAEPEIPDWLSDAAETPSAEPAPAAESEVPDWLASVTEAPAEPPSAAEIEIPGWLADAAETPSAESTPAAEVEVPDWLAGVTETPAEPVAEPEVPDWLVDGVETLSAESTPAAEAEVPDWLASAAGTPSETAPAADQPAPAAETEPPDWLARIAEPTMAEQTSGAEPALPEWLSGVTPPEPTSPAVPAPAEPHEPEPVASAFETRTMPGGEEMPDWLNALEFGDELPAAPLPPTGEDLLGLSEDLLVPAAASDEEEIDIEMADLPEWLRDAAPDEPGTPLAAAQASPSIPADMLSEMSDLRFESIGGPRTDERTPETVGALKDVTGVIKAEILFDGNSLQVETLVDEIVVSADQAQRVAVVDRLLARDAQGAGVSAVRRVAVPLVRWLTALVLIGAIVAATLLGFSILPSPQPGPAANDAHDLVESLPAGSTVILAFEYEPETAGEMQPLAVALLDHLGELEDIQVYAVSSRPTGPAMAEQALAAAAEGGVQERWTNVGFISGGTKGISTLTVGSLPGVPSPLEMNYLGEPTGLTNARLTDLDPGLIVVFSARSEELRAWIEQAGPANSAPMIAAMSAGSAPLAYPYQQSGQLAAVLSGVNDAVSYRSLEGSFDAGPLNTLWNAQAFGGLAAAAMILVGGLVYGLAALRQHTEPE